MTYRVIFSPLARADAMETFRWIADRSAPAANRWLAGLERAVNRLTKSPGRYPVAEDETERFGTTIRQILYGRRYGIYRILFSVEGDIVQILHVRHAARGPIEPDH